jgi:ribonuclease HI
MVKINFDGAFSEEAQSGGWGAIGRDAAGEPVFAVAGRVNAASEALQSELLALVNVIPVAENLGIGRVVFSTDYLVLKQAMETNSYDLSRLGSVFLHAKLLLSTSFIQFSFEYVSKSL